jgi:hypothetical protein
VSSSLHEGVTVDGPDGHRVECQHRDHESELEFPHAHISVNGTSQTKSLPHVVDSHALLVFVRLVLTSTPLEQARVDCLRFIFLHSLMMIPNSGDLAVRVTLRCME